MWATPMVRHSLIGLTGPQCCHSKCYRLMQTTFHSFSVIFAAYGTIADVYTEMGNLESAADYYDKWAHPPLGCQGLAAKASSQWTAVLNLEFTGQVRARFILQVHSTDGGGITSLSRRRGCTCVAATATL